jgi:hypothetical protein
VDGLLASTEVRKYGERDPRRWRKLSGSSRYVGGESASTGVTEISAGGLGDSGTVSLETDCPDELLLYALVEQVTDDVCLE